MTPLSPQERPAALPPPFSARQIRSDFPILRQQLRQKPLVYLDNAATTQKPRSVIERMTRYYETENANIHRGIHFLSESATDAYEEARRKVQAFLHAESPAEIVFTRGTTEAINLVAQSYGKKYFKAGDEIVLSVMEHHANIVPWQMICEQTGAVLKIVPIDETGLLLEGAFESLLNEKTRFVSLLHVSNVLGTINPVKRLAQRARARGIPVLLDGAQAVSHLPVDVQDLGCDFYAFSGHKLYGPTGIGVLYGRAARLDAMPPYQGGGDMISAVSFEKTTYNVLPYKFEAGTPPIAEAIGLGAALDYLREIDFAGAVRHEQELLRYATEALSSLEGLRLVGTAAEKAGVLSFIIDDIHPHDIGTVLDLEGIAIRTGHHCAMPLMKRLNLPATARASLAFYNTREEIDLLARALIKVKEVFG